MELAAVKMMNAAEILELLPRLPPALSKKLRSFLEDCRKLQGDGSAEISLRDVEVANFLRAVREQCEAELKGLLPPGVQDSVQGDVLAQLCFCLLLALAPSLPLHVAQNSLVFDVSHYSVGWPWLSSECGEQALEVLCSALMSQHWSSSVRHLRLKDMAAFGTERACQHLARLLESSHCNLRSLIMTFTGTTANGMSHIARALETNTSLTKLDQGWCEAGDKGVEHFAAMLCRNSTILELSLSTIGMTGEGLGHLCDALVSQSQDASPPTSTGLKMLDISFNKIGQLGAVHLGSLLANNRCILRKLKVMWCGLEDNGEGRLAEGFRTLEELDIRDNMMIQTALEALVHGLAANNSALKVLKIGQAGELPAAELMASMISSNQSLEELDLAYAPYLATEWATIILPALGGNKTLISINLRGCKGLERNQVEVAFFDLLRINTMIRTVVLVETPLYDAGKAEGIQEELRRNKDFRNSLLAMTMTQGKPKSCRLILCGNICICWQNHPFSSLEAYHAKRCPEMDMLLRATLVTIGVWPILT